MELENIITMKFLKIIMTTLNIGDFHVLELHNKLSIKQGLEWEILILPRVHYLLNVSILAGGWVFRIFIKSRNTSLFMIA